MTLLDAVRSSCRARIHHSGGRARAYAALVATAGWPASGPIPVECLRLHRHDRARLLAARRGPLSASTSWAQGVLGFVVLIAL